MRITYSLNSVFFQVIGVPADVRLFLKALYRIVKGNSMSALSPGEKQALVKFVSSYPETLKEQFKGEGK